MVSSVVVGEPCNWASRLAEVRITRRRRNDGRHFLQRYFPISRSFSFCGSYIHLGRCSWGRNVANTSSSDNDGNGRERTTPASIFGYVLKAVSTLRSPMSTTEQLDLLRRANSTSRCWRLR